MRKVLLAVVEDGAAQPRAPFPRLGRRKQKLSDPRDSRDEIETSPEFQKWKKGSARSGSRPRSIPSALDAMTGTTSQILSHRAQHLERRSRLPLVLEDDRGARPHGGAVAK